MGVPMPWSVTSGAFRPSHPCRFPLVLRRLMRHPARDAVRKSFVGPVEMTVDQKFSNNCWNKAHHWL